MDDVRQAYLTALRLAVTETEPVADRLLGRPAPQVLLIHANAVGAAHWDAMFTWLAAHGHRFAPADEVLADDTFRDLPKDPARSGYGHYHRLDRLRREAAVRTEVAAVLEAQVAAWNRGDLEAFCAALRDRCRVRLADRPAPGPRRRARALPHQVSGRGEPRHAVLRIEETRLASGLEVTPFGNARPSDVHGASILARWTLTYAGKPPASGLTLIVLRPRRGAPEGQPRWEITQDASL